MQYCHFISEKPKLSISFLFSISIYMFVSCFTPLSWLTPLHSFTSQSVFSGFACIYSFATLASNRINTIFQSRRRFMYLLRADSSKCGVHCVSLLLACQLIVHVIPGWYTGMRLRMLSILCFAKKKKLTKNKQNISMRLHQKRLWQSDFGELLTIMHFRCFSTMLQLMVWGMLLCVCDWMTTFPLTIKLFAFLSYWHSTRYYIFVSKNFAA